MSNKVRLLAFSALMCALIIVSTLWIKFSIPGTEIMVTTQVFFVLLCGLMLPPRYCLYTLGAYLLLGLIGLPVFSATVGPAVIATASFGYLLSFPFSAAGVSLLSQRLSGYRWGNYVAALGGVVISYAIALPYIAALKGLYLQTPVPIGTLFGAYCFAFLPLDFVKAILAALLASRLEKPLHLSELRAR